MSVTVIRSEDELPPCGNCGDQLRCEQPALIYIFDRFDEIGTEIKTSEINLATCHTCAYRGWIWSGLLVIDRGFNTAERAIEGIEALHMIRKGQVKRLDGRDSMGQAKFVGSLFGIAA